jgi:hypothetical protein
VRYGRIFLFSVCIVFILHISLLGQAPDTLWTRTYGGEHDDCCYSVIESSDGNYVLTGWTRSSGAGGKDVYILKVDVDGYLVWSRVIGGVGDDEGREVVETPDGGYVVGGNTESYGAGGSDIYLVKVDGAGNTVWTKTIGLGGYDYGYSLRRTSDNGFIVAGKLSSFSNGGFDVFLVKADSNGNAQWSKFIGTEFWDIGYSVVGMSDGGFLVAGMTLANGNDNDIYLVKTDSDGDTVWTQVYGSSRWDAGFSIKGTSDGGFIIGGTSESSPDNSFDVYLVKIDSLGNPMWTRRHSEVGWGEAYSAKQISDGYFIVAGAHEPSGNNDFNVYLSRTYPTGYLQWSTSFGGNECDIGYSVIETSDSSYVIAGMTKSFGSGLSDVYLIKTEQDLGIQERIDRRSQTRDLRLLCHPNPFISATTITLHGESENRRNGETVIQIFNIAGRKVRSLSVLSSPFSVPSYVWDGRDERGNEVCAGIYYLRLKGEENIIQKKLIKLK